MLHWQAQQIGDLPGFVHNWFRPGLQRETPPALIFGKGGLSGLQRMETPVIYFYSHKEFTADVEVKFPKGLITEWYPQAARIGPSALRTNSPPSFRKRVTPESLVHWQNLRVVPVNDTALLKSLPTDTNGTHYFAARETDSSFLRMNNLSPTNAADEHEKFLFYRGTGSFGTPLVVTTSDDGIVTVQNTEKTPLNHLFLLHIENGKAEWAQMKKLDSKAKQPWRKLNSVPLNDRLPLTEFQNEIGDAMAEALAAEGLFPAEARAMVKTWSNSWFTEEGVRVLYILPRAWTDEVLPMKLQPQPAKLVRVMVGRAEVITPELQKAIAADLKLSSSGDAAAKERLAAYWKKLGRFSSPAIQLASQLVTAGTNNPVASFE